MKRKAWIIRTGVANLASVIAALRRIGLQPELTEDPQVVRQVDFVVLPGVGAFGAGMEKLRRYGLDEVLRERLKADLPTLAICLGMQLLFEESEESPNERGLGVFPGRVERFVHAKKIPQLGWNQIQAANDCRALRSGYVYFANSYCVKNSDAARGSQLAIANYEEPFIAAIEKGKLLACQFHPELSGELGARILERWAGLSGGAGQ